MQLIQRTKSGPGKDKASQASNLNLFGIFVMSSLGFSAFNLLCNFGLFLSFQGLANKKPPSLVQAVDGRSIVVNAMETRDRTPIVIRQFVGNSLTLMLSANGKLPGTPDKPAGQADAGVPVKGPDGREVKIPTQTWQAGFALSEDFRPSALQAIAGLISPAAFSGSAQMMFVPQHISDPEKVGEGQWKVNVIANLVTVSGGSAQGSVPFNKEVYLRSIDVPTPGEIATPLERAVFAVRQSGLEIYALKEYTPGAIKQ